ncbi:MAG: glycosyltransferase family 2 protein [Candidatus Nanopelagicales bacterium]
MVRPAVERRIAVVMTCHNRRGTTVRCLQALKGQHLDSTALTLFLTDDGSTDGTGAAVKGLWPSATILTGTGELYWAAGMALAETAALSTRPDYLLWLNDDTVLLPEAVQSLLSLSSRIPDAIIVGACSDPETGCLTYGGRLRVDYHPQRFKPLPLSEVPQSADSFHGNVVLIPIEVHDRVGNIDGEFPHAYADDDYGLRAKRVGVRILQAPGLAAHCSRHEERPPEARTLRERWRHLQSPKGLPWRAQVRYLRRHGDWRWPVIFVVQQLRWLFGVWA